MARNSRGPHRAGQWPNPSLCHPRCICFTCDKRGNRYCCAETSHNLDCPENVLQTCPDYENQLQFQVQTTGLNK